MLSLRHGWHELLVVLHRPQSFMDAIPTGTAVDVFNTQSASATATDPADSDISLGESMCSFSRGALGIDHRLCAS